MMNNTDGAVIHFTEQVIPQTFLFIRPYCDGLSFIQEKNSDKELLLGQFSELQQK